MNNQQNQLQSVLQALALPVTGQLRLYPHVECKMNQLIQDYEQLEPLFLAEWDGYLTLEQEIALASLRHDLIAAYAEADHVCTEVGLRRSAAWRRVRSLARTALLTFDWPLVQTAVREPVLA